VKRILLLDDDRQLAAHWRAMLEEGGYYVAHETMVDSAIAALEREPFDLVITDILIRDAEDKLSVKGGFTLLTHISLNMTARPKTIAISGANPQLNVLRHAAVLQADRSLAKPVLAEQLLATVDELLR
jgi:CheY-like chemotaxis protein